MDKANDELRVNAKRLNDLINNAYKLEESRQRLLYKSKTHDILGQRLSILHRYLENSDSVGISLSQIKELITSINDDILTETDNPDVEFENIREIYEQTGVEIALTGIFPKDIKKARIMLAVIREAITNAVRHANAIHIDINIATGKSNYVMIITNDGSRSPEKIVFGTGITGMYIKNRKFRREFKNKDTAGIYIDINSS